MKLIKIINARNVLDRFADNEDIGGRLLYWMTKFIAKTQSDQEFYASEARKIFDKYAEMNAEEEMVVPAEKISGFQKELHELDETEAEDPGVRFDLSELAAGLKLSMRQMYPLLDFINEDK